MIHALAARLFLGGAVTLFGWLFGRKPPGPLVEPAELAKAGLVQYWQVDLPTARRERFTHLVLLDETLYCMSDQGAVVAVDAPTGVIRWIVQAAEPKEPLLGPTHGDNSVCLATLGKVDLYDPPSGELTKAVRIDFAPASAAVADKEYLYAAGLDRRLRCVRLKDEVLIWKVETPAPVIAAPVLTASELYFASRDGSVYACQPAYRRELWTAQIGAPVLAGLQLAEDRLLVASTNGSLYCLDAGTGQLRWRFRAPGQLLERPWATKDTVYQYSEDYGLYAVGLQDGHARWQREDGRQFLAQNGSVAYALSAGGQIVGVDNGTGEDAWRIPAEAVELAASNVADGAIFAANRRGRVVCIRPRSQPYLRQAQVIATWEQGAAGTTQATQPAAVSSQPSEAEVPAVSDPLRSTDRTPAIAGQGAAVPQRPPGSGPAPSP